ncbi:MAG: DUF4145 domain-containing protein [Isosphaeraceae bacterium]
MERQFLDILSRLDRMPERFLELREGVRQAIMIADVDPEMSLTRARKVLEHVVRSVFVQKVTEDPGTRPLENLLTRLSKDGHIPKRINAYATAVRELGNVGTHVFGEQVTRDDVLQSLRQLLPVIQWYSDLEPQNQVGEPHQGPEVAAPPFTGDELAAGPAIPLPPARVYPAGAHGSGLGGGSAGAGACAAAAPGPGEVLAAWRLFVALAPAEISGYCCRTATLVEERLTSPTVRVAFVGRWRQGKTTLINRLLGGDVLPMGETAHRAVVTWGHQPGAQVIVAPGAAARSTSAWPDEAAGLREPVGHAAPANKTMSLDRLGSFLAAIPDEDESAVECLNVFWPSDLLLGGIELIDAPGLDVGHPAAWRDALDSADLVVFVADATVGIHPRDRAFVDKEVRARGLECLALALTREKTFINKLKTKYPARPARRRGSPPFVESVEENLTAAEVRSDIETFERLSAAELGIPPSRVFGLDARAPAPANGPSRLAEFLRRAAVLRAELKPRSALLRLRAEAATTFGPRPEGERGAFVASLEKLIGSCPEIDLS